MGNLPLGFIHLPSKLTNFLHVHSDKFSTDSFGVGPVSSCLVYDSYQAGIYLGFAPHFLPIWPFANSHLLAGSLGDDRYPTREGEGRSIPGQLGSVEPWVI